MAEAPSPTDIFPEPACSFCGSPAAQCRVLIRGITGTAFICDSCASIAAAQARDFIAQQDAKQGQSHD